VLECHGREVSLQEITKRLKALEHSPVDRDLHERIKAGLKSLDEH